MEDEGGAAAGRGAAGQDDSSAPAAAEETASQVPSRPDDFGFGPFDHFDTTIIDELTRGLIPIAHATAVICSFSAH